MDALNLHNGVCQLHFNKAGGGGRKSAHGAKSAKMSCTRFVANMIAVY